MKYKSEEGFHRSPEGIIHMIRRDYDLLPLSCEEFALIGQLFISSAQPPSGSQAIS